MHHFKTERCSTWNIWAKDCMHLFLLWRNVHFAVLGKLCWFWCVPAFSWAHDVLASIVHQTQHCSCSCFKDSKMPTMPSTESVLKVFEGQTYLEEETLLCAPKIEWEISHAFWTSKRFMWFHDISWVQYMQYNATVYFLHHFRSVWVRDSSRVISSGDGPPSGHPRFQLAVADTEWTLKVRGEETLFGEVQQPCRVRDLGLQTKVSSHFWWLLRVGRGIDTSTWFKLPSGNLEEKKQTVLSHQHQAYESHF